MQRLKSFNFWALYKEFPLKSFSAGFNLCALTSFKDFFKVKSQRPIRVNSYNVKITNEIVNFCHDLGNQEMHVHLSAKEYSDFFSESPRVHYSIFAT